jgi:hypothetical protein
MTTPQRSAALVRTAPPRRAAPQPQPRAPRNPLTAAPPVVAAATFAAGVALNFAPPIVALAAPAAVAVVGVTVVQRRTWPRPVDHALAFAAVLAVAGVLFSTATGPSLWGAVFTAALTVVAVRVLRGHPISLAWKQAEQRRQYLTSVVDRWPAIATAIDRSDVTVAGLPVDRAPVGFSFKIVGAPGNLLTGFDSHEAKIADLLDVATDRVRVEVRKGWPREATVHVREQEPQDMAADLADVEVTTILDPLPIGSYIDNGQPYLLRLVSKESGGDDTLIAGAKGSGKSSLNARVLKLLRPAQDVVFIMWNGADGRDWRPWESCFFLYTEDPREAARQAKTIAQLVRNRGSDMASRGWRVWRPSPRHPVLVLFIEEMATFGSSFYGEQIIAELGGASTKNRAVDVVLVGSTQNGFEALGKKIRAGMNNRVEFPSRDSAAAILTDSPVERIPTGARGVFVGETVGEHRRTPVQVVWTDDDERAWIVENWVPRDEAFAAEWARAERDAHGDSAPAVDVEAEPETPVEETAEPVVEGLVLKVREGLRLPDPVDVGPQAPPMDFDEADATFTAMLLDAGRVSAEQVMDASRRKRGWVRDMLIAPAVDSERVYPIDVPGVGRMYEANPEWLAAERAAFCK